MRFYETMYIVHPALEAGRLKDLIELVNGALKDKGNKVLYNELWGKKKLSYFIEKQKYGTYILVQFKGNGLNNNEFNMELEHNPNILAYLTTSIEESTVLKDSKNIDSQIDGNETSNESKKNDVSPTTKEEVSEKDNSKDDAINSSDELGSNQGKEAEDVNESSDQESENNKDIDDQEQKVEE